MSLTSITWRKETRTKEGSCEPYIYVNSKQAKFMCNSTRIGLDIVGFCGAPLGTRYIEYMVSHATPNEHS